MSWLYSRALVAEYLGENSLDGEQCALLSGNPTPQVFLLPDKTIRFWNLSRYGMTCKPLTEPRGEELLTWFRAGFLAKTSVAQEKVLELMGLEAECGGKWPGSFVRYNQNLRLWKTAQCSLVEGLDEFSETWPRWGLMRNGECWGLADLEHLMTEREYGCWLTTPTCVNMKGTRPSLKFSQGRLPSPACLAHKDGGKPNPIWGEWLMGWVIGWTGLEQLETAKFQQWLQEHGGH